MVGKDTFTCGERVTIEGTIGTAGAVTHGATVTFGWTEDG